MAHFKAEELKALTIEIFKREGAPDEEVEILSNHLINANLAGVDSHGVMRIPEYNELIHFGTINGQPFYRIIPDGKFEISEDNGSTLQVNGNWCFGQVTAWKSMNLAIERAKKHGICAVSMFNTSHIGRLGEYTTLAAQNDTVGIVFCNIGRLVAPFGGTERVLGTNPISVGFPASGDLPFVLDFSTAVQSEGKIRNHYIDKKKIPVGWVVDKSGKPTTNPADLYSGGAILPFGGASGYKGYALSLMIEILGTVLTGNKIFGSPGYIMGASGVVMIVLDIERFTNIALFKSEVDQLLKNIRSSKKCDGVDEILIPGEIEFRNIRKKKIEGIELSREVVNLIRDVASSLKIRLDDYLNAMDKSENLQ